MTGDPNERFDRLLKAMLSGPPPKAKGEDEAQQEGADLPTGKRKPISEPRS